MRETNVIADDEEGIVGFLLDALQSEGYQVWTAFDGDQAIRAGNRPEGENEWSLRSDRTDEKIDVS